MQNLGCDCTPEITPSRSLNPIKTTGANLCSCLCIALIFVFEHSSSLQFSNEYWEKQRADSCWPSMYGSGARREMGWPSACPIQTSSQKRQQHMLKHSTTPQHNATTLSATSRVVKQPEWEAFSKEWWSWSLPYEKHSE